MERVKVGSIGADAIVERSRGLRGRPFKGQQKEVPDRANDRDPEREPGGAGAGGGLVGGRGGGGTKQPEVSPSRSIDSIRSNVRTCLRAAPFASPCTAMSSLFPHCGSVVLALNLGRQLRDLVNLSAEAMFSVPFLFQL